MKKMTAKSARVYFIVAAALFYAAGIITLLTNNQSSGAIGWMFIVLGSAQLTLIAALKDKNT